MSDVALMTAETSPRMDHDVQTWVAALGEVRGVGTSKAGALRDLAANLDSRDIVNQSPGLGELPDATLDEIDVCRYCYNHYDDCVCPEAQEGST